MTDLVWRKESAIDLVNLILGAVLFLAPWLFGFAIETAPAWNAWIMGAVVAALALAAILAFAEWEEWLNLAVGVWVALSPWILGFAASQAALWAHLVIGLVVAALAAWEVWLTRHPPRIAAA